MLTKDSFLMVSEAGFGLEHLRLHPVWARFYDPDDALVAESWGVTASIFQQLLDRHHDGTCHAMFPVLMLDPLPYCLDLTVLASITDVQGHEWRGCISGDGPWGGMHVCLFVDDRNEFSFNTWPTKVANQSRVTMRLPDEWRDRFPMRFSTGRKWDDGTPMAGELILSRDEELSDDFQE